MWLATTDGFVSICRAHADGQGDTLPGAAKEPHHYLLMVRARNRDHLLEFVQWLPEDQRPDIMESKGTDYPYRVLVGEDVLPDVVANMAASITYTNFKNACKSSRPGDKDYQHFLMDTWRSGLQLEPGAVRGPDAPAYDPGTDHGGLEYTCGDCHCYVDPEDTHCKNCGVVFE